MTEQKQKLSTAQIVCFGIGVSLGLMLMFYVFNMTGALGGALGGAGGALIGMILFRIYSKFSQKA